MNLEINDAYMPLFPRDPVLGTGVPGSVRYIIVTGGRGSAKSFTLATAILKHTFQDKYNVLYTRYTMVSAGMSIIPEYQEKIDLLNCNGAFDVKKAEIVNRVTGGTIFFRGIMGSSGNQTARLKSIQNVKVWILDEAQELMSENTFDIIDQSIRTKGTQNLVILTLNPSNIQHWIFRRFFAETGVPFDFNGIKDDVCYIHTTYLDNMDNLSESFLSIAEKTKRRDIEKYENQYLGHWLRKAKGLIYSRWNEITVFELPSGLEWFYGLDWGYGGDPCALVRCAFDPLTRRVYVVQVVYATGMLVRDVCRAIREDCKEIGQDVEDTYVYCDPARPDNIAECRMVHSINAVPANNRDKAGRIGYIQGFDVFYNGKDIKNEADVYSWKADPHNEDLFTDVPQDGNDHAMDAINYALTTQLRRMGVNPEI